MGLVRLTVGLTWLSVLSTLGLAVAFLLAWYDLALRELVQDHGLLLLLVPVVLVGVTWALRQNLVGILMRRGDREAALAYALRRARVTLTVGRDEAARNRAAAAEVLRLSGRCRDALELLDAELQPPRDRTLLGLLAIVRAAALLDEGRATEAAALVAPWRDAPLTTAGRRALAELLPRLDAATEPSP